jgi:chromosome segregation ATPase
MFKPKGDHPQWQTIYDHIADMQIGDIVKDADLHNLLPDAPKGSITSAWARAVKQMEDEHSRTFARVRTVGYRMVEAAEHEDLARGQHRRAKRRLGAARRKLHSADRSLLTPEQRRRIDALEDHVSAQQEMIRRLDARIERTEAGLRQVRREQRIDTAELSDRIDRLSTLLRRHGIESDSTSAAA